MYKKIKEYVAISPREFRGMVVVVVILIFCYGSPYLYEKVMGEPLKITVEVLNREITAIESFDEKENHFYDAKAKPVEGELFNFDPNNLSVENWIRLGLSEKQAQSIKKYEAKGGEFRTLADVKKMYAISDEMYARIEPYVKIPESHSSVERYSNSKSNNSFRPKEAVNVDLNSADSVTLLRVRGIGPSFATRILKYRNKLGGFVSLNQLKEVYGVDSLKFEQIAPQVKIDDQNIDKIDINRCTFDEIKSFPYLGYKQAKAIIAYRSQHGNYSSAKDLNKIAILSPELIQKIKPYLKFND